jgi:glycosyltransferase involved in cell wall biosynthesis
MLSTAREDSFGMSIAEALLTGCPVVAPDAGAIGELAPGASYLPLYAEVEQAATSIESLAGRASEVVRAKLAADLPALVRRFSPEALGPQYLAMLARLHDRRMRAQKL